MKKKSSNRKSTSTKKTTINKIISDNGLFYQYEFDDEIRVIYALTNQEMKLKKIRDAWSKHKPAGKTQFISTCGDSLLEICTYDKIIKKYDLVKPSDLPPLPYDLIVKIDQNKLSKDRKSQLELNGGFYRYSENDFEIAVYKLKDDIELDEKLIKKTKSNLNRAQENKTKSYIDKVRTLTDRIFAIGFYSSLRANLKGSHKNLSDLPELSEQDKQNIKDHAEEKQERRNSSINDNGILYKLNEDQKTRVFFLLKPNKKISSDFIAQRYWTRKTPEEIKPKIDKITTRHSKSLLEINELAYNAIVKMGHNNLRTSEFLPLLPPDQLELVNKKGNEEFSCSPVTDQAQDVIETDETLTRHLKRVIGYAEVTNKRRKLNDDTLLDDDIFEADDSFVSTSGLVGNIDISESLPNKNVPLLIDKEMGELDGGFDSYFFIDPEYSAVSEPEIITNGALKTHGLWAPKNPNKTATDLEPTQKFTLDRS